MLPDDDLANSNVGSHEHKDLLTDVELSLNQCESSLAPGRLIVRYAMPNGSSSGVVLPTALSVVLDGRNNFSPANS
jgi:hypothetical protein